MSNKLFVGGISFGTSQEGLEAFFAQAGQVTSATIIFDKMTNRSKGFGFVEMASEEEAQKAIDMLNGQELDGRQIKVDLARPMENRKPARRF